MFTKTIIAAAAAATIGFAAAPNAAQAGVDFNIGIGVPGVYGAPVYGGPVYGGPVYGGPVYATPTYRVSCGQARHQVRSHGYRFVRTLDCHGASYKFKARRAGSWWIIKVRSRNGHIYGAYPI